MVANVPMMNYGYSGMGALNDDFMYNAYLNQNAGQAQQTQGQQVNFQGNTNQQAVGGKGGLGIGALLLGGAAGAGAGYYFANPLKDAKNFKDSFVKSIDNILLKDVGKNSSALVPTKNKYGSLTKLFNQEARQFANEAPDFCNKALKNFKWKQAGKWGAIAAGVLLAGNWLLGKKQ